MTAALWAPPAKRPTVGGRLVRLLIFAPAVAAWLWFPHPDAALLTAVLTLVWAACVLGADLDRYLAMALLPLALVVGAVAAGWIYVVGPAVTRVEGNVQHFEETFKHVQDQLDHLAHPTLPWGRS